ncbi:hypothetical protein [Actinomadura chokoriensis]|uniref:Uncharacterized protein n=1 Tax=Actinomadura chokoriensis TaxID=454156 RepID=A0ABV4R0Y6_9ACTN
MLVDQVITAHPAERAQAASMRPAEPGEIWTPAMLRTFLKIVWSRTPLLATGRRFTPQSRDVDLDGTSTQVEGPTSLFVGERIEGTTKSCGPAS